MIQPVGAGAVSSLAVNFGGGAATAGNARPSAASASRFGEVCMAFILARALAFLPLELARVALEPLADHPDDM